MTSDSLLPLPEHLDSIEMLEDAMSAPDEAVIEVFSEIGGDVVVAGVGGKMGPSLARMARRAFDAAGKPHRVFGVSRFRQPEMEKELEQDGIIPIRADLLSARDVEQLPDAAAVIGMVGFKFGTQHAAPVTWATNVLLPSLLCRRYRDSRIAAFSSGNIYGMVPVEGGGSRVSDPPRPEGEYATTVLGRERMYEYFGQVEGTRSALLRLNYAGEMRYGVLVDIARQVWHEEPVDLAMGYVNVIWQGDANRMSLRALALATEEAPKFNIAGPEILSVRAVASRFGEIWNKQVSFSGSECADAFLNDATESFPLLGRPLVTADRLIEWIANWMSHEMPQWDRPTHFETRGGNF